MCVVSACQEDAERSEVDEEGLVATLRVSFCDMKVLLGPVRSGGDAPV